MIRLSNWPSRLDRFLTATVEKKHQYGINDCFLFFGAGVEAVTGVDVTAKYRGKYTSHAEGIALAEEHGFKDHIDWAKSLFKVKHPSRGTTGDGAIVPIDTGLALGMISGSRVFLIGENGLKTVDLLDAQRALEI